MKTLHTLIIFLLIVAGSFAQVSQAIPYQAVARDINGNPLVNQSISLRFTIHDVTSNGTIIYRETHSVITNSVGSFTANIG